MTKIRLFDYLKSVIFVIMLLKPIPLFGQTRWLGYETQWISGNLEKNLTIPEIGLSSEDMVPWNNGQREIITFGLKSHKYWARTVLKNDTLQRKTAIIELQSSYYHTIDMYILDKKALLKDLWVT